MTPPVNIELLEEVADRAKPLWCSTGNDYLDSFSPTNVLALLAELRAARKVVEAVQGWIAMGDAAWANRMQDAVAAYEEVSRGSADAQADVTKARGTISEAHSHFWAKCAECPWEAGWFALEYLAHESLEGHIVKTHAQ